MYAYSICMGIVDVNTVDVSMYIYSTFTFIFSLVKYFNFYIEFNVFRFLKIFFLCP